MIQIGKNLRVAEQGENASIIYRDPTNGEKYLAFNANGIYVNSTQAFTDVLAAKMNLTYSSGFQTATLASTFMPIAALSFADAVGASWLSTVSAGSTVYAIKTA